MFGLKTARAGRAKDEAEKPFWISFSDLMTSLMVLFLVTMAASLISVTKGIKKETDIKEARRSEISSCQEALDAKLRGHNGNFDPVRGEGNYVVTFRKQRFEFAKDALKAEDADAIRDTVKDILHVAFSEGADSAPKCKNWLKQIIVEGFADEVGGYLFNLNLSYLRSQRIVCELLNASARNSLQEHERLLVVKFFMPGGSSFNKRQGMSRDDQRRVELRLEFRSITEPAIRAETNEKDDAILLEKLKLREGCPNKL